MSNWRNKRQNRMRDVWGTIHRSKKQARRSSVRGIRFGN